MKLTFKVNLATLLASQITPSLIGNKRLSEYVKCWGQTQAIKLCMRVSFIKQSERIINNPKARLPKVKIAKLH